MDAVTAVPTPVNETVRSYAPGSPERGSLEAKLKELASAGGVELTCTIGSEQRLGKGAPIEVVQPHKHAHVLGTLGNATEADATDAVNAALAAAPAWRSLSFDDRAAVFLKAADLLAGPWRDTLNAATMLGQSKTVQQAEIDSACELIDFLRFNVAFARGIVSDQPISSPGIWNRVDYRPLEGFVYAITPFNFTAIAGNLPTAPAVMGNVVVWKPSPTQQFAAHWTMRLLEAAGLPPGVINLVTGDGIDLSKVALTHPDLAAIHFTGSTKTFQHLWSTVGANIASYKTYPRLVGETGGKDFILAHPSADPAVLKTAMVRGAFEYQGQKCSAASRAYVARSVWDRLRDDLFGDRFHLSALVAFADRDWTIGDLGCGTGEVSAALAPFVARVVAVDASAPMLHAAKKRLHRFDNVDLRRGELEALPIDDGRLDAATLMLVLHHVPEPARALAEVARVLQPGGRLILVDMLPHDRENYRHQMGHVWMGFSEEHVDRMLRESGFDGIRVVPLPPDPKAKGPGLFVATAEKPNATAKTRRHEKKLNSYS